MKKKKGFLVTSTHSAAKYFDVVLRSNGQKFYFPFFIRWMYWFFLIVGDLGYDKLTSHLRRE